jgi:hypothetical protein
MRIGALTILIAVLSSPRAAAAEQLVFGDDVAITSFPFEIDEHLIGGLHVITPSRDVNAWNREERQEDWLDQILRSSEAAFSELIGVEVLRTNRLYGAFPPASNRVAELPDVRARRALREGDYDAVIELEVEVTAPRRRTLQSEPRPVLTLKARIIGPDRAVIWRRSARVESRKPLRPTGPSVRYGTMVTYWEPLSTAEIADLYGQALEQLTRR